MSNELKNLIDSLLIASEPDYTAIARSLRSRQKGLQDAELILNQVVYRLTKALAQSPATGSFVDFVILLRQLIRTFGPVSLHPQLWDRVRVQAEASRLVGYADEAASVKVMALLWESQDLEQTAQADVFERRTENEACLGDGMIYSMSEASGMPWTTYRTGAQKAAVDCWMFAAPGSTTLVTLPTGGGKSLCTLLPPWFESRGGRRSRGTTLVVVPTVALAMDQEKQASRFFEQAVGDLSKPTSRTGDTSEDERQAIETALRDGRLPVIYTSPESLLNSRLHDVCLRAAASGLITRFVIDEAHLIASWGTGFRPEFQQLSAYRKRLLEASRGQLRTLLLSATISDSSRSVLERLFADPGQLVVVQANRLRPEISYWFSITSSQAVRRRRVLEALRFLPRPLILYVTRPVQAKQWLETLRNEGYVRVNEFTGNTDSDKRRLLLKQWDENEIDLMVATSAFRLGVDKSDVRAVVHATLPENIDRFYQEVGRSGRDGFSSVSLLCAVLGQSQDNDVGMVYSLTPRMITLDKARPRWRKMVQSSVVEGEIRWLDRDATPSGQHDMRQSDRNREWNDHLLLMMHRAGLIEIVDAPPPKVTENGTYLNHIPVRVLDPSVFNNPGEALVRMEQVREEEAESAQRATRDILKLVSTYATGQADLCVATEFAQLYSDVQDACGGCPVCRQRNDAPYCPPLRFTVDYPLALQRSVQSEVEVDPLIASQLGAWRTLNITWQGQRTLSGLQACVEIIPDLVHSGFQQIIYPEELLETAELRDKIVKELARLDPQRPPHTHRLIPDRWIIEENYPLFALATVVVYPTTDARADKLYRALQRYTRNCIAFPALINVVPEGLYLASEGRHFVEHVDGLKDSIERLSDLLHSSQEMPTFF